MTCTPFTLLAVSWGFMAAGMLALYALQRRTGDAGVVDVGWAAGVGAIAVFFAVCAPGDPGRRVLLAALAGLWSFRLAFYLLVDRVLKPAEDGRYRMLRQSWGAKAQRNFFLFFQVQAFWAVLFAAPLLPAAFHGAPLLRVADMAAIALWLIAVGGETLADLQLAHFRASPANQGKTCREGLWRYSRHPNYFFEWLHWFTYALLAAGAPFGWVALAGPAVMLLFLYKLTGIPYTEKRALLSRGEDYRQYQQTTSAFVPWFPRKEAP